MKAGFYRKRSNLVASPQLAYVIGVVLGDGSAYKYPIIIGGRTNSFHYRVALGCMDKDFTDAFSEALTPILGRKPSISGPDSRGRFVVAVERKDLYEYFVNRGFEGFQEIIEQFPPDFIRGFADSETHVHFGSSVRDACIGFTNTNPKLLEYIKDILIRKFGIHSVLRLSIRRNHVNPKWKDCYSLIIKRQKSIIAFARCIGFTIRRKQETLNNLAKTIEGRLNHVENRITLRDKTLKLYEKGLSSRKIETILGVPNRTICEWVNKPNGRIYFNKNY